jgi:hypothetical protein
MSATSSHTSSHGSSQSFGAAADSFLMSQGDALAANNAAYGAAADSLLGGNDSESSDDEEFLEAVIAP